MNMLIAEAERLGVKHYKNEPMCKHTTFQIGGPADVFFEIDDISKISALLKVVKANNIKLTVIGKGSNLLVSDDGIEGAVFYICDSKVLVQGNRLICNAGAKLSTAVQIVKENSLGGFEFAWGIPGSVGGAVYMNAGAYGGEIKQIIYSVTSLTRDGELITRTADQLELGYRTSVFKSCDEIILSAEFLLPSREKELIAADMDDYLCRRKTKQPLDFPSAGSTFKRPEGYFAGALIEQCELKGYSVGGAMVSKKHAGFVINYSSATCSDVLKLIEHIKNTVKEKTGVVLDTEVIYIGR